MADREIEPCAAIPAGRRALRRREGLEERRHLLRRDPVAGIGDLHAERRGPPARVPRDGQGDLAVLGMGRRVLEDGVARPSAGPSGPECPPRERVDDDDYVSAESVPVTCPATLRGMLAGARRVAEEADAAAEEAKDAVTCQICYANRRDALVMPCCHLLYCYRCVTRASEVAEARGHPDRCPCCRGPISGVLRCKLTE